MVTVYLIQMSYMLSSSEKFNWKIRQELCKYIEKNWKKVGHLGGVLISMRQGKIMYRIRR